MVNIMINNGSVSQKEYEGYISDYFDMNFENEWFDDNLVREIIWEIDKTKVISNINLYNETLGNIPPQYLSSGCKALIVLYKDNIKVNGDRLGDNCWGMLFRIGELKDIFISLTHIPRLPDSFKAVLANDGSVMTTKRDFLFAYGRFFYEC